MSNAIITVCVPVYNTVRYIEECVKGVFAQDYTNWLLLVSDNCSTDGTWELLSGLRHPQMQLFRQPKNMGSVANWNFLLHRVQTEFCCFLGADDYYYPQHLSHKIELLQRTPTAPFVHGPADVIDADGAAFQWPRPGWRRRARYHLATTIRSFWNRPKPLSDDFLLQPQGELLWRMLRDNPITISSAVFRTAALAEHKLEFDTRLRFLGDWHLYLELMLHFPHLIRDNQTTCAYRMHAQNDTSQNWNTPLWAVERCTNLLFNLEEHPEEWRRAGFHVRAETALVASRLLRLWWGRGLCGDGDGARLAQRAFQQHQGIHQIAALLDPRVWPALLRRLSRYS